MRRTSCGSRNSHFLSAERKGRHPAGSEPSPAGRHLGSCSPSLMQLPCCSGHDRRTDGAGDASSSLAALCCSACQAASARSKLWYSRFWYLWYSCPWPVLPVVIADHQSLVGQTYCMLEVKRTVCSLNCFNRSLLAAVCMHYVLHVYELVCICTAIVLYTMRCT